MDKKKKKKLLMFGKIILTLIVLSFSAKFCLNLLKDISYSMRLHEDCASLEKMLIFELEDYYNKVLLYFEEDSKNTGLGLIDMRLKSQNLLG